MLTWWGLGVATLTFAAAVLAALALASLAQPSAARRRLRQVAGVQDRAVHAPPAAVAPAARRWAALARWTGPLAHLASPSEDLALGAARRRLLNAGIRHAHAVPAYFGLKALAGLALPLGGLAVWPLSPWPGVSGLWPVALLTLAALGYYAPNLWLALRVQQRQRALFEAFPDALDLMTVCVEAGLGTEAALLRVARDMAPHSPPLAQELRLVNLELRAGVERERALRNLALRTGVEEIESFVVMLLQAERFGTRLAQSLRVHADTLRTLRRQRAEEAAAKIGLKLLFPLIFCIFPALMVVLMGPAMLQIHRVLLPSLAGTA